MNPRGGTEILWGGWQKHVSRPLQDRVNIILSHCDRRFLDPNKPNILWQHVDTNQAVATGASDPDFINSLDAVVFVSSWQRSKYIREFGLPPEKCVVIRNAIEPVEFISKARSGPLRLLYTSTPWRGLEVLVEAFRYLGRRDIELDVYSSTVIYGKDFMPNAYEPLFNRCRSTPGINYRGYAANKAIIRAAQAAHIFSYPSVFAETSCLSAIEAGAAGCSLVLTDLGALPETCGNWASYLRHDTPDLVVQYAGLLGRAADDYWNNYGRLAEQSKYFNETHSWGTVAQEWNNLIRQVCGG